MVRVKVTRLMQFGERACQADEWSRHFKDDQYPYSHLLRLVASGLRVVRIHRDEVRVCSPPKYPQYR